MSEHARNLDTWNDSQDDDGDAPGWECEECGHIFFVASAWSGPEPECEPGVLCPECGAWVPTDDGDEPPAWDDRATNGPYSDFTDVLGD